MLLNSIKKVDITGVGISDISFNELIDIFNFSVINKQKLRVCVTPINCLVAAHKDSDLKTIYNSADLVLCDGVPILWASIFLKNSLKQRITGLDLLPKFSKVSALNNYSMYFLGAGEGVGEKLSQKLINENPKINIVGVYSPPFAKEFSDEENNKIVEKINLVKPNILWVSLTAPKQDFWIYKHFDKIDANIIIGIGGAFEVTAGLTKRAPLWMQKNGLEWFFRFLQEPQRLFFRYFVEAPLFFPLVIKQRFKIK